MHRQTAAIVRGTCGCGKRYRVRNASPGVNITCPACSKVITISRADIEAAEAGEGILPLSPDMKQMADAREGILLDTGALRLAAKGARPGLTDTIRYTNEEAMLNQALSGRSIQRPTGYNVFAPSADPIDRAIRRSFAHDLLASFWFAGSSRNALNIGMIALCCFLLSLASSFAVGPLMGVRFVLIIVVYAYLYQFLWIVMKDTAAGEDDIPWFDWEFDIYESFVLPAVWMFSITLILTVVPLGMVHWFTDPFPGREWWFFGALALSWFFFPIAVMAVAIGHSIRALRPDHLIRALFAIGPWYLFAWPITMFVLAGWIILPFSATLAGSLAGFSSVTSSIVAWVIAQAVATVLNLYLGYVLFRMFGLLYRHFRHRLRWDGG